MGGLGGAPLDPAGLATLLRAAEPARDWMEPASPISLPGRRPCRHRGGWPGRASSGRFPCPSGPPPRPSREATPERFPACGATRRLGSTPACLRPGGGLLYLGGGSALRPSEVGSLAAAAASGATLTTGREKPSLANRRSPPRGGGHAEVARSGSRITPPAVLCLLGELGGAGLVRETRTAELSGIRHLGAWKAAIGKSRKPKPSRAGKIGCSARMEESQKARTLSEGSTPCPPAPCRSRG